MSPSPDAAPRGFAEMAEPGPQTDDERARALALAFQTGEEEAGAVGPYMLREKIGEGGFGVVWLAEQERPMRRGVAVKVIKSGMDSAEVIARFETERQALALMDHPHIARVFDAGETAAGRPYFVMELVRGVPITKYCEEHSLSTEARLRLFIAVCHGVQHAHQKGIVHRDLKPSNILVAQHDGAPLPKIIDFGIAKATGARLADRAGFTQHHAFIGTPAYTSPEQMEMGGLDVDTRSDIYSLGVLLYELLAGRPPFDPDALMKSGLDAMRHTIRDVEPPRPAQRVRALPPEAQAALARQQGTEEAKLLGRLRDLDWIALRCLEKDRARRYETAGDLAADVDRHLANEPVRARPPGAAYRLSKYVRRHRLAFAAGSAVLLALVAGLIVACVALVREHAARTREAALRIEADANAAKSAQVARFMNEMLAGAEPSVALGRDPALLREIADATVQRLGTELLDQPGVAADLRDTLGGLYLSLGQTERAEDLLRQAVALHRAATSSESAETAHSLHLLSMALRQRSKASEMQAKAEEAGREALRIREKLFGDQHPLVADTLCELAQVQDRQQTPARMREMIERALAIRRRAFGNEHPAVAQALAGLGSVAQLELNHNEGARLHAEALAMRRRLLGNSHPEVARSLAALGDSYAPEIDRKREAAAAYDEAFALRRKLLGDSHPKVLIPFLGLVGQLTAQGISPEQSAALREFGERQRQALPRDSVLRAPVLLALASLEPGAGSGAESGQAIVEEARAQFDAALARQEPFDPEIIHAMMLFSWSKLVANVPGEGRAMAEETVKLAEATFRQGEDGLMLPLHVLAWINLSLGRKATATALFEKAIPLFRVHRGESHPVTLMNLAALAGCYRAAGRSADARQLLEAALAPSDDRLAAPGYETFIGFVTAELGVTLAAENRPAEAEAMLRRALLDYERLGIRALGRRLRPQQRVLSGLGVALAGQGRFAEAESLAIRAFEEMQAGEARLAGDRAGMVREAYEAVLAVYTAWGRPEKIAEWKARVP